MSNDAAGNTSTFTVGALLRDWRRRRRLSQLELALQADSSARHISFIETGRSRPSQEMVLRLAEHLDVPVRERNELLIAAGYAPRYTETPLDDPAMVLLRTGLDRLLEAYEPNPALIMNGTYDIVAANRGAQALLGGISGPLLTPPMNVIRLALHPQGLAPRIRNLSEWRAHLLDRIRRQISLCPWPSLRALYEEVSAYPLPADRDGHDGHGTRPASGAAPYAFAMRIEVGGRVLSFISTITTFNTPTDVTVSELAVEAFLPADPETAEAMRSLAGELSPAAGPGSR